MAKLLIKIIAVYRYCISPLLISRCRFYPSCSHYTQQALQTHGTIKGLWLASKRILRCHPFHQGGIDLVPEAPIDKLNQTKNKPKQNKQQPTLD